MTIAFEQRLLLIVSGVIDPRNDIILCALYTAMPLRNTLLYRAEEVGKVSQWLFGAGPWRVEANQLSRHVVR